MSTPSNASILETAASLLNLGDVDGFVDTLFAPDSVDHDPAPGQGAGREGYRSFFHTLVAAFPDANFEPVVEVADDRHVAVAYTLTGTHRGDFRGGGRDWQVHRGTRGCRSGVLRMVRSLSAGGARMSWASWNRSARPPLAARPASWTSSTARSQLSEPTEGCGCGQEISGPTPPARPPTG